ncbi:hypothetical protein FZC75_05745 [Sutcliffiella horikoshii]|uniref:Uncharacterized protein n=1 Tax=Sutcliffiella horikoshii TaxID=79883 RepID=A0A5D4TGA2_9BACI|nr:hypothetical protein FZC75_05745 [Sutcliffiella horikoshii]
MEQKAKTPEGDSARWRPRRLAEEAPAAPLGKRSHLRKSTAASIQPLKSKNFSIATNGVRSSRTARRQAKRLERKSTVFMKLSNVAQRRCFFLCNLYIYEMYAFSVN